MCARTSLALIAFACLATAASAQEPQIDYDSGEPPVESQVADAVASQTEQAGEQVVPAQRVIPMRRSQATGPLYAVSPVVQPGDGVIYAYPVQQAATYYVQAAPVAGSRDPAPATVYAHAGTQVALPPGAQLVTFDRPAWLTECRKRLGIDLRDPATAPAGPDECEAYLDDYMASAAAGRIQPQPVAYGQQYMLVPVTVLIPQQAIYREAE